MMRRHDAVIIAIRDFIYKISTIIICVGCIIFRSHGDLTELFLKVSVEYSGLANGT